MPTPHYGQPRYRVIAEELRKRIESGLIPPGALLPAESTLAVEFEAARGTIRQAIAVLRDDGLVTTEHGRGTYAITRPHGRHSNRPSQHIRESEIAADSDLAFIFNIEVGAPLIVQESVIRDGGRTEEVIRAYRAPRSDQ
ncbi:GntR family transcriptional regulator [Micromonospora sp. NPDC051543]|uniref:GntR family transcriptional regulator n=1 Tax=Micromonospora sp. NPDC051543 TaxID=3364287 RepID=UPI0037AB4AC0